MPVPVPTVYRLCSEEGTVTTDDGLSITCVYADGQYHDIYQVTSGTRTCAANQANSCPDGMDIWVPRSYDHAKAVYDIWLREALGVVYHIVGGGRDTRP